MKSKIIPLLIIILLICSLSHGQNAKVFTTADYQAAAKMLSGNVSKLIDNDIQPEWLTDGRLWYKSMTENIVEFKLFNPVDGKKGTVASRKELFAKVSLKPEAVKGSANEVLSPDGKYAAFIRGWNLWIKEVGTGTERALTSDGLENFGYATDNAGWKHSDRPVLSWSPDSKKIATFQQDQRHVSNMYLVKTKVGAPELHEWKYPLPGDSDIIRIYRVIIDINKDPGIVRMKMSSDARRGTLCDDISCKGGFDDVAWSEDSKHLVFVSTSRDHKQENVRIADCETGEVKNIFEEKVATQYDGKIGQTDIPPLQKKGSVNIAVRQDKRRHGIATTLLDEAIKLWNINLKNQDYTNMGERFITNYMRTSIIYKLSRQFRVPKSIISIK